MYHNVVLAIPRALRQKHYSGSYLPYGPLKLLSYAKRNLPEVTFSLVDGSHFPDEKSFLGAILARNPDLVGLSAHSTFTYPDCLRIYKQISGNGIDCVFGGLHVSYLPILSVANQGIEVIQGQAFDGFVAYVRGGRKKTIPNLVWKQKDTVHQNPVAPRRKFDELPLLDFSFIRIEDYWKGFQNSGVGMPPFHKKCFTIFTHEGCVWRDRTGGCKFCHLPLKAYFPNPRNIWREIQKIVQDYGPQIFFRDYGDLLTGNWDYVKQFVKTRPSSLVPFRDYVFEIYSGTRELREGWQADLLKSLGALRVYLGYESFSDRMLQSMRKGATIKDHWRATELLLSRGIYILASCVLGCEGENEESLKENFNGFKQLKEFCGDKLFLIAASQIAVLPGSPIFEQLVAVEPQHGLTDIIDFTATRRDWFRHFVNLGTPEEAEKRLISEIIRLEEIGSPQNFPGFNLREAN